MRALIVEDQLELRQAVAKRFRASGHAADEAGDGAMAESFVRSYAYDVLVLDRLLPDGDAIALLQRWRGQGIQTPALFLTACDRIDDRIEGLASGADDYLIKPFSMDELMARIAAIARRGGAIRPSVIRVGDLEVISAAASCAAPACCCRCGRRNSPCCNCWPSAPARWCRAAN